MYVWEETLTQPLPENGRTLVGVAAAPIVLAPRSRSTLSVVIHALSIKDRSQGRGLDQLLYEQLHQALYELGQQAPAASAGWRPGAGDPAVAAAPAPPPAQAQLAQQQTAHQLVQQKPVRLQPAQSHIPALPTPLLTRRVDMAPTQPPTRPALTDPPLPTYAPLPTRQHKRPIPTPTHTTCPYPPTRTTILYPPTPTHPPTPWCTPSGMLVVTLLPRYCCRRRAIPADAPATSMGVG